MADSELADLTNAATLASTDILYAVVDPAGTPLDRKVTVATLQTELTGMVGMLFGDGSDGDVTVTGGTTTLTRDMFYNDLTISSTGVLDVEGYRVFVRGTLTIAASGRLHNDGLDAITQAGGNFSTIGTVDRGGTGGSGVSNAAGAAGTNVADALGGTGGVGGLGTGGAGGAAGTVTAPSVNMSRPRTMALQTFAAGRFSGSMNVFRGGSGGGGGGGDATPTGGGGGGAGGNLLMVVARIIANSGTMSANGGAGADRQFGTNVGGGGGGGGGLVVVSTTSTAVGTVNANGGAGGPPRGTGVAGSAGSAGLVILNLGTTT